MSAPDLVIVVRAATNESRWLVPADGAEPLKRLKTRLPSSQWHAEKEDQQDLVHGLTKSAPARVGTVPAVLVHASDDGFLKELLTAIDKSQFAGPSAARRELQRRLDRSPIEVAIQLSKHYGHKLSTVAYIPALALIGRLRLGAKPHIA